MKSLVLCSFILLSLAGSTGAAPLTHGSVGIGHGIAVPHQRTNPCSGTLVLNYDGSAEDGYCWQYGGIVPGTQYGAFAECYNNPLGGVCGIELNLTSIGNPSQPATLFVWDDNGGMPGNVLAQANVTPSGVPMWPSIGTFDYPITANAYGNIWVGYWADFSAQGCGYFIAADLNGFGGCPMTNIAPGIGYPTGWNNTGVVWGQTQAIGIGAWVGYCMCCGPVRCGDDPGPCCFPDGTCQWVIDCAGYWSPTNTCDPSPCSTNTSSVAGTLPEMFFRSMTAVPNPSTGEVFILYRLAGSTDVTLQIFDARGAVVRRMAEGPQAAGPHAMHWDGRGESGARLPAGTYFTRIETPAGISTGKVVLTR